MADLEVPELDVFAIDFSASLSRPAPPIYRDMPTTTKASGQLVGDDYDRVTALRGYVVPRLADDRDPPNVPPHATYCRPLGGGGFFPAQCRPFFICAIPIRQTAANIYSERELSHR